MHLKRTTVFLLFFLLCVPIDQAALAQEEGIYDVTIHAVDKEGKPIQGMEVALYWRYRKSKMTPRNLDNKRHFTDKDGKVTLPITGWSKKRTILLFSLDRKSCGLVIVEKAKRNKNFKVTIEPSVEVTGQLFDKQQKKGVPLGSGTIELPKEIFPRKAGNTNLLWEFFPEENGDGKFKIYLPAGKFRMWANGIDVTDLRRKQFAVPKDSAHHNLGPIAMDPSFVARYRGKPVPALETILGSNEKVTIEKHKGKWVLLYFWGYW